MKVIIVVAAVLAFAATASAQGYQGGQAHQQSYDAPARYSYQYAVDGYGDDEAHFSAQESRDGANTQGSYTVALPDGRTQTVNYNTVDAYSGNVAEVTYSGQAQYPAQHRAPAYKAAPAPAYNSARRY